MNLRVRPYRAGDEVSISEMFTRNTPYLRDLKFWVWINRLIPTGSSLISVATDEKENVIGHTAIMPYEIKVGERIIKCGMSYHTIVDKDYRDMDLIMPLLELADKLATDAGMEFHFGFPNRNARPIYKFPNHAKVEKFFALERDSKINRDSKEINIFKFVPIENINYDFLYLLNHIIDNRKKELVEFNRTLNYYIARYFFHPQNLYKSYKIYYNNAFVGCLITKLYEKDGIKYFHIIDLLVDESSLDMKFLVREIICYFSDCCDRYSFWKVNERFKQDLMGFGFEESGFDTFLGLCFLQYNKITDSEKSLLLDFKNWRLVMGDSDAF